MNSEQAPTEIPIEQLKKFSLFLKEYKLGAQTMSIGRRFHSGTTLAEKEDR